MPKGTKSSKKADGFALRSKRKARVPTLTLLETGLPVVDLYDLAKREGNAKKPIYEIHKWWARRLGSVFRALLIAATTPGTVGESARQSANKLFSQFYQRRDLTGLVVLDPFMGGGTSVVEALKRGARVIGVDVDPVAWFVTKKQIEPITEVRFEKAFAAVSSAVEGQLRRLYRTVDPTTKKPGEIVNAFWVSRITCGHCRHHFDAHPHFRLGFDGERKTQDIFCKKCGTIKGLSLRRKNWKCTTCRTVTAIEEGTASRGHYSCTHCGHDGVVCTQIKPGRPLRKRLFAIEFTIDGDVDKKTGKARRHLKRATRADERLFAEAARLLKTEAKRLPYPRTNIFRRRRYDLRPISHGYSRYAQLFNARQLYCLTKLYGAILAIQDRQAKEYLLLAFSDSLAANNELVGYAFGYRKTTPLFGIHGYHVVQRPVEGNVWGNPHFGRGSFTRCVGKLLVGKKYAGMPFEYAYSRDGEPVRVYMGEAAETRVVRSLAGWKSGAARALLLNKSSVSLRPVPSRSVNLILTDPPFYDNLPYSELSDFYFQWLRPVLQEYGAGRRNTAAISQSLFARRKSAPEHTRYLMGLTEVMQECARVLKRSGILAFTFHHREPAAWHALASAIAKAGLSVTGVSPVRAEGVSGFHSYEGTPKWDSVISCRLTRRVTVSSGPDLARMVEKISRIEKRWFGYLKSASIRLSSSDRSSLASSLALREGVNASLPDTALADLFGRVFDQYPQKGVARTVPGMRFRRAAPA